MILAEVGFAEDQGRAMISGAIAALGAEVFAEMLVEDIGVIKARVEDQMQAEGRSPQHHPDQFKSRMTDEYRRTAEWAKLGSALVTLLASQDVDVSMRIATNALEHNFIASMEELIQNSLGQSEEDIVLTQDAQDYEDLIEGYIDQELWEAEQNLRGRQSKRDTSREKHRSLSPPYLCNTEFGKLKEEVCDAIPEEIKTSAASTLNFLDNHTPASVKTVAVPLLKALEYVPDQVGTKARRTLRHMGMSQAWAQDIGDVVHFGTAMVLPGTTIKGIKGGTGIIKNVTRGVRAEARATLSTTSVTSIPQRSAVLKNQHTLMQSESRVASLDLAQTNTVLSKVHKNSRNYQGETHVYRILDKDGKTYKIGESAQGLRKTDGASKRAEAQARRLNRKTGEDFRTEVRRTFETKKEAHQYQHKAIKKFRELQGKDSLPGNKNDY